MKPTKPITSTERERRWTKLRERIEDVSHLLIRQGALASRLAHDKRVWSVRYREPAGDGRRRVIYVGADAVLVRRVRELLGRYRQRDRWVAEVAAFARLAATLGSAAGRLSGRRVAEG
jgi:hypothetical protein